MSQTLDPAHHFDPLAALITYISDDRHKLPDGTCKSMRTMARDLQCSPDLLPPEWVAGATGASLEELRGLPVMRDAEGRPRPLRA